MCLELVSAKSTAQSSSCLNTVTVNPEPHCDIRQNGGGFFVEVKSRLLFNGCVYYVFVVRETFYLEFNLVLAYYSN